MFFKGLKEKSIKKAIRSTLLKPIVSGNGNGVVSNLAIIINYDKLVDYKPLLDIAKAINISNGNIFIAGYVEKKYKNVNYLIPVFSEKSFGMGGKVKEDELKTFLIRKYDVVINYYKDSNLYLELVSALCKSDLKVGLTEEGETINNLVLKVNERDYDQFTQELVKYLTILKRL